MAGAQSIFDTLATAAGHPINRGLLNLQVAQAQAMNGFRDASTQEALAKARMARDQADTYEKEQNAVDHLSSSMTDIFGDPDIARGAAEALFNKGQNGLKDFYEGLNEHDIYTLGQRYMSAPANQKPVLLQAGLAANAPWAVAEYNRETQAPQQAAVLKETQDRDALVQAQTRAANANADYKNKTSTGQLTDDSLNMGAYFLSHFGVLPPTIGGFGMAGARAAVQNHLVQLEQAGSPLVNRQISNPEYDSIYQLGQSSIANQHALNTGAAQVSGGVLGRSINSVSAVTQHLELLRQSIAQMNNGDMRPLNALAASYGINTGQPAPVVAKMTAETVGGEYANIYAPGNSTQAQRDQEAATFAVQVMAPGQSEAVISRAQGFMEGKMTGNEQQWIDGQMPAYMQSHPGADPVAAQAALSQTFRTQVVNDPTTQSVLYGAHQLHNTQAPETLPGETAANPAPPAGAAPTPAAASGSPAASPPRLTQTPPGTPGGTPAGSAPGAQAPAAGAAPAPPVGAPQGSVAPTAQPATSGQPPGHQGLPTTGPHGGAPGPGLIKQSTDPNDPGINHLSNGEVWSWRAGDVPRYVGMMPVPTPGQGTTATPNMPVTPNGGQ